MMDTPRRRMVISHWWAQTAILTFLGGFTVLGMMAYKVYTQHPPIPERVVDAGGQVIFTGRDILSGQQVFRKYGLMQHGTIFGHGAYLGPDFTAEYLHKAGEAMLAFYAGGQSVTISAEVRQRVRDELKNNTWDAKTGTIAYTPGQVHAYRVMADYYRGWFGPMSEQQGLKRPHIADPQELRDLAGYFSWAAWVCSTQRPGTNYSYTNNWPDEPMAANSPRRRRPVECDQSRGAAVRDGRGVLRFRPVQLARLAQRADRQPAKGDAQRPQPGGPDPLPEDDGLVLPRRRGAVPRPGPARRRERHYHANAGGMFGTFVAQWLPYNLTRTWHVQLALFFIVAAFLAMGIFIAPMVSKREPKGQGTLALIMFIAIVAVVVASLLGEAASIKGYFGLKGPWFWLGNQGWEYLDLGRLWQILLVAGMVLWLVIVVRGIRPALAGEHPGNMPYLFLYSALSLPLFYAVGLAIGKDQTYAVADFWRFWVVHLWVEDFLELLRRSWSPISSSCWASCRWSWRPL